MQSDPTPIPVPPEDIPESPMAQTAANLDLAADDIDIDSVQPPLTPQAQFDLDMMRDRLAAQLSTSKDPLDEKLPEPKASAKYWVSIAFSLAALFLVAYLFVNIMRDAIQSQPVTAGLEDDVLQADDGIIDDSSAPQAVVTIVPNETP